MSSLRSFLRYRGRTVEIVGSLLLGRSSSCDISLDDSRSSREHCRVLLDGERVVLVDLDSRNGVSVNDARVEGERELHHGDVIRVGDCQLVLLRQQREPREERPSSARTRPAGPAPAWGPVLQTFLSTSDAAARSGDWLAAEAGARNLFVLLRQACVRAPEAVVDVLDLAVELGLTLAEQRADPRWLDEVIALHLSARHPMSGETARRLTQATEGAAPPDDVVLGDYLAATERLGGVSGRARGELVAAYALRASMADDDAPPEERATVFKARDALRETVLEKIRENRERGESGALASRDAWKILVEDPRTLVDQFDRDGRRYVIACRSDPDAVGKEQLTEGERRVADGLARGAANKVIAYELDLSTSRVANIVRAIKKKLGVESRSEAVMLLRWARVASGDAS